MFGVGFEHTSDKRSDPSAQREGEWAVSGAASDWRCFRGRQFGGHEGCEPSAFRHGENGSTPAGEKGADCSGFSR